MGTVDLEDECAPKTVDRLLSALSREPNRGVVNFFREFSGDVASLDELAEYAADSRNGCDARSPEQVAIRLHHVGLPKLADAGVLDYDPRSKTVRWWGHPLLESEG